MRPIPLSLFSLAAASPLALLALAITSGGLWPFAALLYMAAAAAALDLVIRRTAATPTVSEFPATAALLTALGLSALALLPVSTWAIAGPSGLPPWSRAALFLATGLWLGQVAHPAAHELIHRPRPLFWLGLATYTALLFGHHTSSHRLVHHQNVATPYDPNTARANEGFYRFALRAWGQSFRKGWAAESRLRARSATPGLHPYTIYIAGAALSLTLATLIAGLPGLLTWAGLGLHASAQILLSDYVQHYGLTRAILPGGRPAPVNHLHSWNAAHWASSALMLNAPRHSDHHTHPARPFPALRLADDAPLLPWPLPIACLVALVPPYWRHKMRPELARIAALANP